MGVDNEIHLIPHILCLNINYTTGRTLMAYKGGLWYVLVPVSVTKDEAVLPPRVYSEYCTKLQETDTPFCLQHRVHKS